MTHYTGTDAELDTLLADPSGPGIRTALIAWRNAAVTGATGQVIHLCPADGDGSMSCCGLSLSETPRGARFTEEPAEVTCSGDWAREKNRAANPALAGEKG
jgi:hypothetical protein